MSSARQMDALTNNARNSPTGASDPSGMCDPRVASCLEPRPTANSAPRSSGACDRSVASCPYVCHSSNASCPRPYVIPGTLRSNGPIMDNRGTALFSGSLNVTFGAAGIVGGVGLIAMTGPAAPVLAVGGAFALAGGTVGVGVGMSQIASADSGASAAQDADLVSTAIGLGCSPTSLTLVGLGVGLVNLEDTMLGDVRKAVHHCADDQIYPWKLQGILS
jgi:hypothetical protein